MRCESFEGCEEICPGGAAAAKTVVLIGKIGNGKSATGNSIIGRQVFESMPTSSCKLATTVLSNGQILNVIDTPGLFDSAVEPHERAKEIAKCLNMAKDGIHAVLLVMSLRSLRWEEEAFAFESLCHIFGGKIADYVILVFAHGDHRVNDPESIDHFCRNFPQLFKTTLRMCKDRVIAFDNKTQDEAKISSQRKKLLSLVEDVVERNGGKPYTNDKLVELMKGEMNLIDQSAEGKSSEEKFHVSREEEFYQFIDMVELSLKESILEKQLDEEKAARMEAQVKVHALQTKSKDEAESRLKESIHNLEKQLAEERDARMEAEMKVLSVQTKSKDDVLELKECLKQLAEETAARMEAEMKALALQTKSKGKVLALKNCLDRVEKSPMQLEEKLHRVEKQMAKERAARMEAEMKMLSLQTKSKDEVLEMKQCLNGAEESCKHIKERLHGVESIHSLEKQLADERSAHMDAEMRALALQTKSKDEVLELKDCLNRVERKHLEDRLHIVESIRNLEKQMAEERAARMEAEIKALSPQTKSKDDVLELKECLNRAEESHKQLEERLHRVESIHNLEKQSAEERAARMEAEMKALSLQTKPKHDVLELKGCLNRAEESRKQLEERLHIVEKQLAEERAARMKAEMKAPKLQTRSKNNVLELKECLNRAEKSRMQLEERLHKVESIHNLQKQLADGRVTQMEAEMKALSLQIKSKGDVLELKECLNRAEESQKQLEERLHSVTGTDNTTKTSRKENAIQDTTHYLPEGRRSVQEGKMRKSFKGFVVGKKKYW